MQTFWYTDRKENESSEGLLSPSSSLEARRRNNQDTKDEKTGNKIKKRRINRPGFNSYLKVLLEDDAIDILHHMSAQVQKRLHNESEDGEEKAGLEGKYEVDNQQQGGDKPNAGNDRGTKKPLRFKPRSRQSLHMTLYFGGETICALPPDELVEWHRRLSIRLASSGFILSTDQCSNRMSNPNNVIGDYSFHFKGMKVFPPHRNNLIVAILEPSPLWHDLHNDIRQIAKDESCSKGLAEVSKFSKEKWVAHITLGNLYGGPKSKVKSLQPLLDDIFDASIPQGANTMDSSSNSKVGFQTNPLGISMGGPMPTQATCDWEFRFRPPATTQQTEQTSNNKSGNPDTPANPVAEGGVVSDRCTAALKPSSPYAEAFMKAMNHQYDAVSRPDGYVPLCVAENKLSIDILATKLSEMETTRAAFSDPVVFCYNSFQGLPFARQVAASFIEKNFWQKDSSVGLELSSVDPSHIGIGSGAAGILHSLFYLLGEKGDCCLIPTPYYAAFENQMSLVAGISPFGFHIENPVLGPTESDLELAYTAAISRGLKPKFFLLTNPHNPLGIIYKPEVVAAIVSWARGRNLHTIADEVYALSTHQKVGHGFQSIIQILNNQLEDNVHWLWSISKDFGASGLRVGYMYSQNENLMNAFANLNGFSGVSQPMQMLVSKLLSDDAFVDSYLAESRERLLRNYNACAHKLNEMGIPYVRAEAGLFIYADFSSLLPERTMEWESKLNRLIMDRSRVLLTPGESQREQKPGMFRICYAWVTPEELRVGMERLGRLVKEARGSVWADLENTSPWE